MTELPLAQGQKASGSAKSMMIHSNLYWFGFICFSHFNPIAVAERAKVNQNTLELDVSVSRSCLAPSKLFFSSLSEGSTDKYVKESKMINVSYI